MLCGVRPKFSVDSSSGFPSTAVEPVLKKSERNDLQNNRNADIPHAVSTHVYHVDVDKVWPTPSNPAFPDLSLNVDRHLHDFGRIVSFSRIVVNVFKRCCVRIRETVQDEKEVSCLDRCGRPAWLGPSGRVEGSVSKLKPRIARKSYVN